MNLGENIYRLRTEKNMSQGDLADALEVSRQSVSKWENNSAVPELEKLMKMAALFGVTLDQLVGSAAQTSEPIPEASSPAPAPAPQKAVPAAEVTVRQGMSVRNIIGIVILCCSILSVILFLIFLMPIWILLVSLPLALVSVICLLPGKHFWRNTWIILGVVALLTFLICSAFFGLSDAPVIAID